MVAICCWGVTLVLAVAVPLATVSGISDLISIGSSLVAVAGEVVEAEDDEEEDVDDTGETSVAVVVVVAVAVIIKVIVKT